MPSGPLTCTRLWHCFGHSAAEQGLQLSQAEAMLDASRCSVVAINTHLLRGDVNVQNTTQVGEYLRLGVSDIKLPAIVSMLDRLTAKNGIAYTKFVNVNLQTTSDAIVRNALLGMSVIRSPYIKYEAMDKTGTGNRNKVMIEATKVMLWMAPDAVLMPQIDCDLEVCARRGVHAACGTPGGCGR